MTDIEDKWGPLVAQRGFAQVPNHLLLINMFLDDEHKLTPTELLILIQLVGTWWRTKDMPFPSMTTLATRCGVSSRQVQRSVTRLEKLGLMQRVSRRTKGIVATNAYDLAPLTRVLTHVARAFPNPYPRIVDKVISREVNALLKIDAGTEKPAGARRDTPPWGRPRPEDVLKMLAKDNRTHVLEERGAPYDMDLKGPVVTIIADGNAVVEFPGASGEALLRALVAPGYLQEASWDGDKGHRTYKLTPKGRDHAES